MIRGKTLQLRLGENINVPKISGSPIRNADCIGIGFVKNIVYTVIVIL